MYYVTIHLTIEEFFLLFLLSFQYFPFPIFPCASSVHPPRGPSSIHYSNHRPGKKKAVTLEYLHDKKQARKTENHFFFLSAGPRIITVYVSYLLQGLSPVGGKGLIRS